MPNDSGSSSLDSVIESYKESVDITLIRENLELTPEERVLKLIELQRFAAELQRAGRRLRLDPGDRS